MMTIKTTLMSASLSGLLLGLAACGGSSNGSSAATSADAVSGASSTSSAANLVTLSAASYMVSASSDAAQLTVDRNGSNAGATTVAYTTVNGTATAGTQYTATSGTLAWIDGDSTAKTISVPISAARSSASSFAVALSAVSGASSLGAQSTATVDIASTPASSSSSGATGSSTSSSGATSSTSSSTSSSGATSPISSSTSSSGGTSSTSSSSSGSSSTGSSSSGATTTSGTLSLSSATYGVTTTAGQVTISVARTAGSATAATVTYVTANGTAVSGTDFTSTTGSLSWVSGDTSAKTFAVPILSKGAGGKSFTVALSAASGATLGTPATSTISISAANSSAFSIAVSGNRFVNGSGATVQLRGVNMSGLELSSVGGSNDPWGFAGFGTKAGSSGVPGTVPDDSYILSQHANVVRLPLNEESWLGYSNAQGVNPDQLNNYVLTVEKSVAKYTADGIYVILDLHWSAPGSNLAGQQQYMADSDHALSFWTSVANAFKNNPAVLFDLYNEPHLGDASMPAGHPSLNTILRNGGNYGTTGFNVGFNGSGQSGNYSGGWSFAGFQTMLNTVRATGAVNVVLMSGDSWSNDETWWTTNPPTDTLSPGQIAISHHDYPQGLNYDLGNNPSATEAMLNAPGVPVVFTEMGENNDTSTSWFTTELPLIDAQGYSAVGWALNPANSYGGPNLLQTFSPPNATVTGAGAPFFSWMLNHK